MALSGKCDRRFGALSSWVESWPGDGHSDRRRSRTGSDEAVEAAAKVFFVGHPWG